MSDERIGTRSRSHEFDHVFARLRQLRQLSFVPATICDVGASDGRWTRECMTIYPEARYLCVEPLEEYRTALATLEEAQPSVTVFHGCLGAASGSAILHSAGFSSSLLSDAEGRPFGAPQPVTVLTLNELVRNVGCGAPDLLKVDVQGSELDVLRGAGHLLRSISAIVVELTYIQFYAGMPTFYEVASFLAAHEFALSDILSMSTRPLDGLAAQSDVLFIASSHPLRASRAWDRGSREAGAA